MNDRCDRKKIKGFLLLWLCLLFLFYLCGCRTDPITDDTGRTGSEMSESRTKVSTDSETGHSGTSFPETGTDAPPDSGTETDPPVTPDSESDTETSRLTPPDSETETTGIDSESESESQKGSETGTESDSQTETDTEPIGPTVDRTPYRYHACEAEEAVPSFLGFDDGDSAVTLSGIKTIGDNVEIRYFKITGLLDPYCDSSPIVLYGDDNAYDFWDITGELPFACEKRWVKIDFSFGDTEYSADFFCCYDGKKLSLINLEPSEEAATRTRPVAIPGEENKVILYLYRSDETYNEYAVILDFKEETVTDLLVEKEMSAFATVSKLRFSPTFRYAYLEDEDAGIRGVLDTETNTTRFIEKDVINAFFPDDTHLFFLVETEKGTGGCRFDLTSGEYTDVFHVIPEEGLLGESRYAITYSDENDGQATLIDLVTDQTVTLSDCPFGSDTTAIINSSGTKILFVPHPSSGDSDTVQTLAVLDIVSGDFIGICRSGGDPRFDWEPFFADDTSVAIVSRAAGDDEHIYLSLYRFADSTDSEESEPDTAVGTSAVIPD